MRCRFYGCSLTRLLEIANDDLIYICIPVDDVR